MYAGIHTKIADVFFVVFYLILFPLQVLPNMAVMLFDIQSIWFWVMCGIGFAAMVTQAIKFPCMGTRVWEAGMFALFIASFFMKGWIM